MAVIFQVRGTSLTAYYSNSGSSPGLMANSTDGAPAVAADAGAFGGSIINCNLTASNNFRGLIYPGNLNTPSTAGFAVLIRFAPNWSGNPANIRGLWQITGTATAHGNCYLSITTTGKFNLVINRTEDNTNCVSYTSTASFSPTAGTYYDIMVSWDGTTTAGAVKLSVDGVEFETTTASNNRSSSQTQGITRCIGIGINSGSSTVRGLNGKLSEFVIWDNAQSHTYATRTDFISASNFDGLSYSDPGIANVKTAVQYTYAGSTLTGSYTGADRWSDPGIANVLSGTSYLVNGSTVTGSYSPNFTDPGASNVRLGTEYLVSGVTTTGTLNVPTPASGTAGTVDIGNLKETIRFILSEANTTTGSPIDLSDNLTTRVASILKLNPEKIQVDVNIYPCVTVFCSRKSIKPQTIGLNQVSGTRRADITLTIVGIVWNDITTDYRVDSADEDIEKLMENVEYVLRYYANLNNICNWQFPTDITYHSIPYDEQAHMRVGVMELQVSVLY